MYSKFISKSIVWMLLILSICTSHAFDRKWNPVYFDMGAFMGERSLVYQQSTTQQLVQSKNLFNGLQIGIHLMDLWFVDVDAGYQMVNHYDLVVGKEKEMDFDRPSLMCYSSYDCTSYKPILNSFSNSGYLKARRSIGPRLQLTFSYGLGIATDAFEWVDKEELGVESGKEVYTKNTQIEWWAPGVELLLGKEGGFMLWANYRTEKHKQITIEDTIYNYQFITSDFAKPHFQVGLSLYVGGEKNTDWERAQRIKQELADREARMERARQQRLKDDSLYQARRIQQDSINQYNSQLCRDKIKEYTEEYTSIPLRDMYQMYGAYTSWYKICPQDPSLVHDLVVDFESYWLAKYRLHSVFGDEAKACLENGIEESECASWVAKKINPKYIRKLKNKGLSPQSFGTWVQDLCTDEIHKLNTSSSSNSNRGDK